MFMLEVWSEAHSQHLERETELFSCLTKEMKQVANEIIESEKKLLTSRR